MSRSSVQERALGRGLTAVVERTNEQAAEVTLLVRMRGVADTPFNQSRVMAQAQVALRQAGLDVQVMDVAGEFDRLRARIAHLQDQLADARRLIETGIEAQTAAPARWMSVAAASHALGVSQATISRAKSDGRIAWREVPGKGRKQPRYEVDPGTFRRATGRKKHGTQNR